MQAGSSIDSQNSVAAQGGNATDSKRPGALLPTVPNHPLSMSNKKSQILPQQFYLPASQLNHFRENLVYFVPEQFEIKKLISLVTLPGLSLNSDIQSQLKI